MEQEFGHIVFNTDLHRGEERKIMEVNLVNTSAFARAADPSVMVYDEELLVARHRELLQQREVAEKADKAKRRAKLKEEELIKLKWDEHEQLSKRLSDLRKDVDHFTNCNKNYEGTIKVLQSRIDGFVAEKKQALRTQNVQRAKSCASAIRALTSEQADAKKQLRDGQKNLSKAVRVLAEFDGHKRIAELQKELNIEIAA